MAYSRMLAPRGLRSSRRGFLKAGAAAALSASCSLGARRPDVLLIVAAGHHAGAVGYRVDGGARTPSLDRLARRAIDFTSAYCAAPAAGPSLAALLTGRMPSETGVYSDGQVVRAGIPNLGGWLREQAGYDTVWAGEWNLPEAYQGRIAGASVLPSGITGDGGLSDAGVSQACEAFLRNRLDPAPLLMGVRLGQPGSIDEWLRHVGNDSSAWFDPPTRDALPGLPANFDYEAVEPRMLQQLRQAGVPARRDWSVDQWRRYLWSYDRCVEAVDGEIGRLLDEIENSGRGENTVIVFTSDRGEGLARHQLAGGGSSYEESVRVPLLISWPSRLAEGAGRSADPVSAIELVPTVCAAAGVPPPPGVVGRSLLSEGESEQHEGFVVIEIPPNAGRGVRAGRYKLVSYADDTVDQLYDLQADPGETRNLAGDVGYAEILNDLRSRLSEWEAGLDAAPDLPGEDSWWRRA